MIAKEDMKRKNAKQQRRKEAHFSLTPGFSQVIDAGGMEKPFQRFFHAGCKLLKRFSRHAAGSTPLKRGVNGMSARVVERFEVSGGWLAFTPDFSPRRGRILHRLTRCRVSGKSSPTLEQPEAAICCSLSPGERTRVRASVKTNFIEEMGSSPVAAGQKSQIKNSLASSRLCAFALKI
jgi:hypothetical protein